MRRLTEFKVQQRLARHYDTRVNVIIPNVSWGFFRDGREVDLLIVRPSLWCDEIEIKLTANDIKAEKCKKRYRNTGRLELPPMIRMRYFCVPKELANDDNIPDYCGIITLHYPYDNSDRLDVKVLRPGQLNPNRRKLSTDEYIKLLQLCHMRMWNLRNKLARSSDLR